MWLEDAACNKLAELALNDVGVAGSILREAVSCSPFAVRSVDSPDVHKAFQQVPNLPGSVKMSAKRFSWGALSCTLPAPNMH